MSDQNTTKQTQIQTQTWLSNPFPGLRPFTLHETSLFFGREEQTDALLEQLSDNRFVAVIGASGSGKSSLVRAGLIPVLYGGFMTDVGSKWRIVITRPGGGPINNLAEALTADQITADDDEDTKDFKVGLTNALLRTSSLGLTEVIQNQRKKDENILILVDQFEELFRYREQAESGDGVNESMAFVNLLLEAVRAPDVPLFVMTTMRSDFLGECAQFRELTQAINDSHYLIPRMTRDQLKSVIEGPILVGGGVPSERLIQRLLNEVGDNADQLTVLQHAMMRTWQYWQANRREDEKIDIQHYEAIGTMTGALSRHADEAYFELENDNLRRVAEKMFKAITERDRQHGAIRRPTQIAALMEVTGASFTDLVAVIEKYRIKERSLLMPPEGVPLTEESIIDISHESLIWIWDRLTNWVREETASMQMYSRLAEAAEMYQQGQTRTWRPPDLHLALNWRDREEPTLAWARRYNPAFERTMAFLSYSKEMYDREVEREELRRKREIRRVRITALIMGVATIICVFFLFFSVLARMEAEEARKEAIAAKELADKEHDQAVANEKKALEAKEEAEKQKLEAEKQKEIAEEKERIAQREKEKAKKAQAAALAAKQQADKNAAEALRQKDLADKASKIAKENEAKAKEQEKLANLSREEAERLMILSAAKAMAIKSKELEESQLKGLLAYQAYRFNNENKGKDHEPDIYRGLYEATKEFQGENFNVLRGHTDGVRALAYSPDKKYIASAGSDGTVLLRKLGATGEEPQTLFKSPTIIRSIDFSPDGRTLAWSGEDNRVWYAGIGGAEASVKELKGHSGMIREVFFAENRKLVSASTDSTVRVWDPSNEQVKNIFTYDSPVKSFAVDKKGKVMVVSTENGKLHMQDLKTGNAPEIQGFEKWQAKEGKAYTPTYLAISPDKDGKYLAIGTKEGPVLLWNRIQGTMELEKIGHKSEITNVVFNDKGTLLGTSSLDGTARLWNMEALGEPPIVLEDHQDWVWNIDFSADGKKVATGSRDGKIKQWDVDMASMAKDFCKYLERNMSDKEWELYVGGDIEFVKTCKKN